MATVVNLHLPYGNVSDVIMFHLSSLMSYTSIFEKNEFPPSFPPSTNILLLKAVTPEIKDKFLEERTHLPIPNTDHIISET